MWRWVSVLQSGEYTSSNEARAVVAASLDAATCVEVVIRGQRPGLTGTPQWRACLDNPLGCDPRSNH